MRYLHIELMYISACGHDFYLSYAISVGVNAQERGTVSNVMNEMANST